MSNNSDHNDFENWQNGDEFEMNNPNNHMRGFFFYGNPDFKKIWEQIYNNENPTDSIREYLNMDEIMKNFKQQNPENARNFKNPRRMPKSKNKSVVFTQDEYLKLIEIRGYLAITEQFAHVKALDKLINQITILPKAQ